MNQSTITPPAKTDTEVATKKSTAAKKPTITSAYQLQKRVMLFAVSIRAFTEKLPKHLAISNDVQQLVRSSGNLGMHAIAADEAASKKAFVVNMKICRKEVKEILYWLQLMDRSLSGYTERRRLALYSEAHELRRIFTAICKTASKNS